MCAIFGLPVDEVPTILYGIDFLSVGLSAWCMYRIYVTGLASYPVFGNVGEGPISDIEARLETLVERAAGHVLRDRPGCTEVTALLFPHEAGAEVMVKADGENLRLPGALYAHLASLAVPEGTDGRALCRAAAHLPPEDADNFIRLTVDPRDIPAHRRLAHAQTLARVTGDRPEETSAPRSRAPAA